MFPLLLKMALPKVYGLIKRGSKKDAVQPRLSLFDDDSDEDAVRESIGKSLQREAARIQAKKQTKLDMENALAEDPSVFDYDEVYDNLVQQKKEEVGLHKKIDTKKSKYIDTLLKAAKSRKLEQERVVERQVQKQRLAEGEQFADKEAFVTSAFKKKMQEMQEQEEKDRREAQLEALTDVTKQKDLSGFYRNLYRQTLCAESTSEQSGTKDDISSSKPSIKEEKDGESTDSNSNRSKSPRMENQVVSADSSRQKDKQRRHFRRRRSDSSSSESDEKLKEPSKRLRKNRKSNSSSKSCSDSSADRKRTPPVDHTNKNRETLKGARSQRPMPSRQTSDRGSSTSRPKKPLSASPSDEEKPWKQRKPRGNEYVIGKENRTSDKDVRRHEDGSNDSVSGGEDTEPKMSTRERLLALFKKRNVGDVFEQAHERYLARKAARTAVLVQSAEK